MFIYTLPPGEATELPEYLVKVMQEVEKALNQPDKFTAEQFRSQESQVNTRFKIEGRPVWDITSKKPVWPTGNGADATWIFGDGTVAYSPVSSIIKP